MATEIYSDTLAAGAETAELTVTPLAIHGIAASRPAIVVAKNDAGTNKWAELKRLEANEAAVIYPTSATVKVLNLDADEDNDIHFIAE